MKQRIFLLVTFLLFVFCLPLHAQYPNCFRITFADKNDSPYSIEHPENFLSPRAIAKRVRFNISVTEQDFPVNPQYINSIQSVNTPTEIIATSKWNNSVVIFFPGDDDCQSYIDYILDHFPFVTEAAPVAYYNLAKNTETPIHEQISNAIVYSSSSCDYNYGNSIDNMSLHNGHLLHKAGFCGEDMLICVLDVGWSNFDKISYFQALYENGQIWGTRDLIPGMNNVYTEHGHGTLVTSEIASCIEGQMVGTAPKANFYFIRSDDPIREQPVEEDFYAQGLEIADSLGVDVSTASLGYTTFDRIYNFRL
jgi:subtilisin family serine protease